MTLYGNNRWFLPEFTFQFSSLKVLSVFIQYSFLLIGISVFVMACAVTEDDDKGMVLAEVYQEKLYERDIRNLEFSSLSYEDSIFLVEAYIENWVRTQLKMKVAETSVKDLEAIEAMVKDYRTSLLIHRLEEDYLKEHLDTIINEVDMLASYEALKTDFALTKALAKGSIIFCNRDSVTADSMLIWLTDTLISGDDLAERLNEFACDFAIFHDQWHEVSIIAGWLSKPIDAIRRFGTGQKPYTEISDEQIWGIYLSAFIEAGQPAPLERIENRLTARILKERRRKILNELHEKLYTEALSRNKIKYYNR